MTHGRSLIERLEALVDAANETPPKPLPEQDTRAAEAMAGIEDQRRYRSWQDRVLTARAEITEIVPEAAALIRELVGALSETRPYVDDVRRQLSRPFELAKVNDLLKRSDVARAKASQ